MGTPRNAWHDFISLFRTTLPDGLRPIGAAVIRHWFGKMEQAADHGNGAEVARLAQMIERKVNQEINYQRPG